jgi:hypothetical protein
MATKHTDDQSLRAELARQRELVQIALAALQKASAMAQTKHGSRQWCDALLDVNKAITILTQQ